MDPLAKSTPAPGSSRAPLLTLAFVFAVGLVQHAVYLPRMPATMATHFDGAGRPNGFMSGGGLVVFEVIVLAIVIASTLLPVLLVRYSSGQGINLPNKEYWFAPERIESSRARLTGYLLWLLPIIVGFLVAVDQLVFQANLEGGSLSSTGVVLLIVALLVALAIWTIVLLRAFPRPPGAAR